MAYTKCPLLKKKDGRVTASPNHTGETLTKILRFAQDDQNNVGHAAVGWYVAFVFGTSMAPSPTNGITGYRRGGVIASPAGEVATIYR